MKMATTADATGGSAAAAAANTPAVSGDGQMLVYAGPSTRAELNADIQLTGQVTNNDFRTLAYAGTTRTWSKTSGPGNVVFANSGLEFTTATFDAVGTYELSLNANDGTNNVTDTVTIEVVSDITSTVTARKTAMMAYLRGITPGNFLVGQQGVFGRNQYRNMPLAGGDYLNGPNGNALGEGAAWPYENGGAAWEAISQGLEAHDGTTDIPDNPFYSNTRLQLAGGNTSAAFPAAGSEPAFLGADIGGWTGSGDFYVDTDQAVHALIDHWHRGGIGHLGMQYLPSPLASTGTGAFTSDADVDRILSGGDLRATWTASMDLIVDALLRLQNQGIPVIWRPFGETHGGPQGGFGTAGSTPFWWQVGFPESSAEVVSPTKSNELWTDMHDYFSAAGVMNIVWAWTPLWWNTTSSFNSSLAGYPVGGTTTYVPRLTTSTYGNAGDEICEIVGWSQYVSPNVGYSATYDSAVYPAIQAMIAAGEISSDVVQWICEFGFGIHGSGTEPQITPFDMSIALEQVSNRSPNVSIVSNWVTNSVDDSIAPGSTGVDEHRASYGLQSQTNVPAYMADSRTIVLGQLSSTIFATGAITAVTPTAPVVSAGSDQVLTGLSTTLTAATSSENGTHTVLWTQLSGPGSTIFSANTSDSTTATVSTFGTYVFRITATEGTLSSSDTVSVTFAEANTTAGSFDGRALNWTWGDPNSAYTWPASYSTVLNYYRPTFGAQGIFNFAHIGSGQVLWYYGGTTGNNGGPSLMWNFKQLEPNATTVEITLQPAIDIQDLASGSALPSSATSWLDVMIGHLNSYAADFPDMQVVIRLFHECNGSWFRNSASGADVNRYGGFSLASNFIGFNYEYAATHQTAFQRVVDYMRGNFTSAANNAVLFLWSPNAFVSGASGGTVVDPTPAYPGTSYVDLIGLSWYIAPPGHGIGAPSPAITSTGSTDLPVNLTNLAAIDSTKPLYLGETAIAFGVPDRGTRISEYFVTLNAMNVVGINWFAHDAKAGEPSWTAWDQDGTESAMTNGANFWRSGGGT